MDFLCFFEGNYYWVRTVDEELVESKKKLKWLEWFFKLYELVFNVDQFIKEQNFIKVIWVWQLQARRRVSVTTRVLTGYSTTRGTVE